jgi:hypothetical protein
MTTNFNIGSQHASSINNIGRDQHIDGGINVTNVRRDALSAIDELRKALTDVKLDEHERLAATDHLDSINEDLRRRRPDKRSIGERLRALATILASAGAFATGSSSLIVAITAVATLLGRHGTRALHIVADATP